MPQIRYTIELCPPVNPANIDAYYQRFKHLLNYTNSFSISSHATSDRLISGFYRSYNLAHYLTKQHPLVCILFHVTCHDLNRVNIHARLSMLKNLGIRRILIVTGEGYCTLIEASRNRDLLYKDSSELLKDISEKYKQWFELIAIAGYPPHEVASSHNLTSIEKECDRLAEKSMNGTIGAIYTQCLFSVGDNFVLFSDMLKKRFPSIELIPSIALFNSYKALNKSSELTKVSPEQELLSDLKSLEKEDAEKCSNFCKMHLKQICQRLKDLNRQQKFRTLEINICSFGLFDFAADLIKSLMAESEN